MISGPGAAAPRRSAHVALVAALAAGVAAIVLVIAGAHVRPDRYGNGGLHLGQYAGPTPARTASPSGSASPLPRRLRPSLSTDLLGAVFFLLGSLAVLAAIVALVAIARAVLRRRSIALRSRRTRADVAPEAPPDLPSAMREAVAGALEELSAERPAGDAIIRCWQRLVAAAAGAGQAAAASDTPEETITRVQQAGLTRVEPLRRLADLYREARFSRHTMSADDLAAARAALIYVLGDLEPADA